MCFDFLFFPLPDDSADTTLPGGFAKREKERERERERERETLNYSYAVHIN